MKATTLSAPQLPENLSMESHWLAGEGAGSWFELQLADNGFFQIQRYSPKGILECKGFFKAESEVQDYTKLSITYPSHCQQVTVVQNGTTIALIREDNPNS